MAYLYFSAIFEFFGKFSIWCINYLLKVVDNFEIEHKKQANSKLGCCKTMVMCAVSFGGIFDGNIPSICKYRKILNYKPYMMLTLCESMHELFGRPCSHTKIMHTC